MKNKGKTRVYNFGFIGEEMKLMTWEKSIFSLNKGNRNALNGLFLYTPLVRKYTRESEYNLRL